MCLFIPDECSRGDCGDSCCVGEEQQQQQQNREGVSGKMSLLEKTSGGETENEGVSRRGNGEAEAEAEAKKDRGRWRRKQRQRKTRTSDGADRRGAAGAGAGAGARREGEDAQPIGMQTRQRQAIWLCGERGAWRWKGERDRGETKDRRMNEEEEDAQSVGWFGSWCMKEKSEKQRREGEKRQQKPINWQATATATAAINHGTTN